MGPRPVGGRVSPNPRASARMTRWRAARRGTSGVPHPAVGDAGMQEDDGLARALIVEGQATRGSAAVRGIPDRVARDHRGVGRLAERRLCHPGSLRHRPPSRTAGGRSPYPCAAHLRERATDHAAAKSLARPTPTSLGCADGRPAG